MAGGACGVTQPAMQNMYREMARFRAKRQAYLRAKRSLSRAKYKEGEEGLEPELDSDRVGFTCLHLCARCGALAGAQDAPCAGCGGRYWLDLSSNTVAERLREEEGEARHVIPISVSVGVFIGLTLLAVGVIAALFAVSLLSIDDWGVAPLIVFSFMAVIALFILLRRRVAKLYFRLFPSKLPIRWRMPVLPMGADRVEREVSGAAEGSELITAPFSGSKCLGYKISVLFDVHGDARPPEWVLAEMSASDFSVNGTPIPGRTALVATPLEPVEQDVLGQSGIDFNRFLRERGLFENEGAFWCFESIIAPGDSVTAKFHSANNIVEISND